MGRLALVTGAAGPMGLAAARLLAAEGATVSMIDVNEGALRLAADAVGENARADVVDIADPKSVDALVADLERHHGQVAILVNNAGILSNNRIDETDLTEWNRILDVNLTGAFVLIKRVLPAMRAAGWGRIINTSSYAALSGGVTAGLAYTVSKGGILALTRAIAAATAGDGITCNAIAPAWVRTPMVTEQLSPEKQAETVARIPVGRFSEPEEFAHTVGFLASGQAGFITGETINANGGARFA